MALFGSDARMTILAYADDERKTGEKKLSLPFKAESLKLSMANQIECDCTINSVSGGGQYQGGEPAVVDVTFLYDTTIYDDIATFTAGPLLDKNRDLKKQLKTLMDTVYSMDGKVHESRFLILKWGEMPLGNSKGGGFYCRLKKMDVNFTLVGGDGKPLVAEVSCRFIEHLSDKAQEKMEDKSSPDLTHIRQVLVNDSLPYKTWDIYKDPRYLVDVARVNGLDTFRRLKVGQSLIFPPLEQ